jgi:hypothetical protein
MNEFNIYDRSRTNHRITVAPLAAFEAIRRILGHAAVVSREELDQLLDKSWSATVLGYAAKLRARMAELHDDDRPAPVLPVVDAANLDVRHTTCTGGTELKVDRSWLSISREHPFNLNSGRDLAIALLGMAAFPNANYVAPDFWSDARGTPSDDAIFGAFLALRKAGFTDDEVVALMAPAGLVPNPTAIGLTVVAWDAVDEFDRRYWLYGHAALFGDTRDWIPLPAAPQPTRRVQLAQAPQPAQLDEPLADWERELLCEPEGK